MDDPTHPHELRKDETGRTGTDEEHLGAEGHLELVHTVDSARGGLEKSRLLIRQVLDLVALGEVAGGGSARAWPSSAELGVCVWEMDIVDCSLLDVVGETTVTSDTGRGEVLAEELLTTTAVVAPSAGLCHQHQLSPPTKGSPLGALVVR